MIEAVGAEAAARATEASEVWDLCDQTLLPGREVWLEAGDPAAMIGHIQRLAVRGAPLNGEAAALSLAWLAQNVGTDAPPQYYAWTIDHQPADSIVWGDEVRKIFAQSPEHLEMLEKCEPIKRAKLLVKNIHSS